MNIVEVLILNNQLIIMNALAHLMSLEKEVPHKNFQAYHRTLLSLGAHTSRTEAILKDCGVNVNQS